MRAFILWFTLGSALCFGTGSTLPNYELLNQDGKAVRLQDFKGKYLFISFVYTRCPMPKMCPLTMTLTKQLLKKWKMEKNAPPMHVIAATLEPQFDTPAVIKEYSRRQGLAFQDFTFLTGKEKALSDFASEFNVIGFSDGKGFVSHNIKSVLLDPDLNLVEQYKENEWKADKVLSDIKKHQKLPKPSKTS